MANNNLPIVLKDGKHAPLDPATEYMNVAVQTDDFAFSGDGSSTKPFSLNLLNIDPQYNRLQQKSDGLFATAVNYQQFDVICDLGAVKYHSNGYGYLTGKVDYSRLVVSQMGELTINTWSWTGQTVYYTNSNYDQIIPYTLAAINWKPTEHTLEFHFLLFKKPSAYKHYFPTQTVKSGEQLHYSVYFNYYYK
ncbi:hypothetical protein [Xenorhabdus bharatensis]|uniref:hypothetical protein n=1 Tax=Xenorhabdus bharatensis TaxID=3136256 RepID=UPI0030F39787